MEYIYVLECQKNKYFIGKTYNIQIEYNEHLDGTFCDLTKEYKPIGILCIFEQTNDINTNIIIGKYILKYGKENIFFIQEDYIDKNLIKNNKI
jgi:predicted GIY-YIG superfamily endonuclease